MTVLRISGKNAEQKQASTVLPLPQSARRYRLDEDFHQGMGVLDEITMIKLALPLITLLVLAGIYVIKVETWQLKQEVKTLERQIAKDQRAIVELRAEWAYLTRPQRIEKLAREHLKMRPVKPEQIIVQGE